MQKMPMNTMPPRTAQRPYSTANSQHSRSAEGNENGGISPALQLAQRIRNEQGRERALQFLLAMEPFLAPAERSHIAGKIGVTLPPKTPVPQQQGVPQQPFGTGPFAGQMPMQFAAGKPGNPMQMAQILSGLNGMGQKSSMGGDPMALAQLLGNVMGNRKK